MHITADDACNQLAEDAMFIEDDSGDLQLQNQKVSNNTIDEIINTDEVEEVPEDALCSLSNLKKYKINNICHRNLYNIGWSILGENKEEDQRWAQMMLIQEENKQRGSPVL